MRPYWIRVDLNPMTGVLSFKKENRFRRHTERMPWDDGGRDESDTSQGMKRIAGGTRSQDTLILDFRSRTVREYICYFKTLNLWYFVMEVLENLHRVNKCRYCLIFGCSHCEGKFSPSCSILAGSRDLLMIFWSFLMSCYGYLLHGCIIWKRLVFDPSSIPSETSFLC